MRTFALAAITVLAVQRFWRKRRCARVMRCSWTTGARSCGMSWKRSTAGTFHAFDTGDGAAMDGPDPIQWTVSLS